MAILSNVRGLNSLICIEPGHEIDFILKKGTLVQELLQVAYDVDQFGAEQREVKALIEAAEELDVLQLTVLTWDTKKTVDKNGKTVRFVPLWCWLIEKK